MGLFRRRPYYFTTATGDRVVHHQEAIVEPEAPAVETVGPTRSLRDTPRSVTERYALLQVSGAGDRLRIDRRLDGGAWADAATPVAVGGTVGTARTVELRAVALPHGEDTASVESYEFVALDTGVAGWDE
jgi:hypothetical protein